MPARGARPPSLLRALASATHPGPAVAVTAAGTLLAVAAGIPAGRTALVCAAVVAGQASIGWSNDWLDADRDRAVARADKPVVQGAVSPSLLRAAALLSAAAAVALSLLLGIVPGLLLLLLVASGWAYNAGLKRTIWSFTGYVVGFGALPAGVVAAAPGSGAAPWWLVAAGAALGGAAHLANVAPDLEDDLATGVRGLPHRLGARVSAVTGAALLGAASLALVLGPAGPPTTTGWAALALAVPAAVVAGSAGRPRFRRLAFPAVMVLTVLDVVLLVLGGAALS
ncbi:UbiA family prenyltransferase [Blastococcus atacamensis]|uniref:UbiA family prenyltransferase n=1 Tax=Blastococcus atacamensis TaxID=2070508 RepID=UPI000CEBC7A4|nr:UbiA family prenyltransferase [Blastococcus atacamensis]